MKHNMKRRGARMRAVPWSVGVGMLFVSDSLPEEEYKQEMKNLVRRSLVPFRGWEMGPFRIHDERVRVIVEEVAAEA